MPDEEAQPTVIVPRPPRFARLRRGGGEGEPSSAVEPAEDDPSHTAILIPPERADGEDTIIVAVPEQAPAVADFPDAPDPATLPSRTALERERKALIDRREEALYHLGGLAFEAHRRDLLPEGALRERADVITDQERRLAEIDAGLLALASARAERRAQRATVGAPVLPEAVGTCPDCATGFFEGARFCFNCGVALGAVGADGPETGDGPEESANRD